MINLFRKKYKRSDWMEGLLGAERDTDSRGVEHCSWALNDTISNGFINPFSQYAMGYRDYLNYNKNILSQL